MRAGRRVGSGKLRDLRRRELAGDVPHLVSEGGKLLGLPLPLVQHLGQRLQGREGQLQGHAVGVAGRGLFQEVLQKKDELRKPLNRLHHEAEEADPVVRRDLLDLEEVRQRRLSFRLLLCALHRGREVVDEVGVDLQHDGLREGGHEHVTDLLILVPVLDGLGESDPEESVAVQDFRDSVEEKLDLVVAQDRWVAVFQRFLVILKRWRSLKLEIHFSADLYIREVEKAILTINMIRCETACYEYL